MLTAGTTGATDGAATAEKPRNAEIGEQTAKGIRATGTAMRQGAAHNTLVRALEIQRAPPTRKAAIPYEVEIWHEIFGVVFSRETLGAVVFSDKNGRQKGKQVR